MLILTMAALYPASNLEETNRKKTCETEEHETTWSARLIQSVYANRSFDLS